MIKITKAGWIYIALTIFLGVAAINTGNNLLYLIVSAMLSFMGVSGYFGRKNMVNIDISVHYPAEVFQNVPFNIKLKVENSKKYLPSFLLKVNVAGEEEIVPYVKPGGSYEISIPTVAKERGYFYIDKAVVSSPFPFNFFIRYRQFQEKEKFLVYPKPEKCKVKPLSSNNRQKREREVGSCKNYEGEFFSVKDYSPGDPIKYIHWKSTAKTGDLKSKEFIKPSYTTEIIEFERIPIPNIEKRIRCATYIVLTLSKNKVPFKFKIRGNTFNGLREKEKILKELALYGKD